MAITVTGFAGIHGLDVERLVIASVSEGSVPPTAAIAGKSADVARKAAETEERSLVYIAATRVKKELLVSSCRTANPFFGDTRTAT